MSKDFDTTKKCILYIDDQPEELLKLLTLFEEDYDYHIMKETSVQAGLDLLKDYYGVVDAIILDLSFPSGTLQGEDGLKSISETYPELPVFILTGADNPEDEEKALHCLSLGAADYYHKSNFDVHKFIIQIDKAIAKGQETKKLNRMLSYQGAVSESPRFEVVKDDYLGGYSGCFIYKLSGVVDVKNTSSYSNWCKEVLRTIAVGFENLSVKQYLYKDSNGLVHVYFVFMINDKTEKKVEETFRSVVLNFALLFNSSLRDHPLQFVPVKSVKKHFEIITLEGNSLYKKKSLYLYKKECKEVQANNTPLGFSGQNSSAEKIEIPVSITTISTDFDKLFRLLYMEDFALIVTKIKKIKLQLDEVEALRKVEKKITGSADKPYSDYVRYILENQNSLFQIETFFYTDKKNKTTVLNSINEVFYDNKARHSLIDMSFFKDRQSDKPFKRIPFIYTIDSAIQLFKIPMLSGKGISSYTVMDANEARVPAQARYTKGVLIGKALEKEVHIDEKQFQKHTYILGKTGTGKTSVLYTMLMDRINKGYGCALIDPHGDIFDKVLETIPEKRKKDIILFDPTDEENSFGFNILEYDLQFPEQKSFIVNELLKIFSEIYNMDVAGGPMFELYFKNAAYLIMETKPEATLEDVAKVFSDKSFRDNCLSLAKSRRVKDFFKSAAESTGEMGFENFTNYITSKLTRFTDNYFMNKIICDPEKSFNFRKMIDSNKIFLVKLNKGRLGDEGVNFIGRLLFNRIIMAAYTRSDIPEDKRKDFSLFVDEFQNFTSKDIVSALGEARKYHLQLVLANQTFAQLEDNVAKNILANVGSIITAAISPFDASMIVPFFKPDFEDQDIIRLDNFQFIIKTLYDNKQTNPFIFNSIPY